MIGLLPVAAVTATWITAAPAMRQSPFRPSTSTPIPAPPGAGPLAARSPLPTEAVDIQAPRRNSDWQAAIDDLQRIAASAGPRAHISIAWWDLSGSSPRRYSLHGADREFAASTYKLPLLVETARRVSAGRASWKDTICYRPEDAEDSSFYEDYDGRCLTRQLLAERTGRYSDNTAAHMLTRDLGGPAALNSAARRMGTTRSEFFTPNTTTADDLAAILDGLGAGRSLTPAAKSALTSILSHTAFERGVPAGVPSTETVIHKVGSYGSTVNDAALVTGSPRGSYILVVLTEGVPGGEEAAWPLIKRISSRVHDYERRP